MSFKIFRTSKTRVTNLIGFKNEPAKTEPQLNSEEVSVEESSVGDAFEELFGESGQEVKPEDQNRSVPRSHVKGDDESDDNEPEEEPPKREYNGRPVAENVNPSKTSEVESADLNDLISSVMEDLPVEDDQPAQPARSTPSKGDGGADSADFGGFISMIRDENDPPEPPQDKKPRDDQPRDVPLDRKRESSGKPTSSSIKTSYSFSSKFVPNIPASFYKEIQAKLEDLIFKFECLDNEYAALQKISHKVYIETMDVKKILANED